MFPAWLSGFQGVLIICICFCVIGSLGSLAFDAKCFSEKPKDMAACFQKSRSSPARIISQSLIATSSWVLVIIAIASAK